MKVLAFAASLAADLLAREPEGIERSRERRFRHEFHDSLHCDVAGAAKRAIRSICNSFGTVVVHSSLPTV